MEPLILTFRETPKKQSLDFSIVKYSEELNLSVLRTNGKPAVKYMNLGTETFTKTQGEGADTDISNSTSTLKSLMDTSTETYSGGKPSDADRNHEQKLRMLLDTTTITEAVEGTDSDK